MAGTIKEVAKRAGVSYQAVSAVLNGNNSRVSKTTRERIFRAVEEIGYHPNRIARGLASGSTDLIGFLAQDLHSPYYADLAYEVQNAADRRGLQLLMVEANWNEKRGLERIKQLTGYGVDALLLIGDVLSKIREHRLVDPGVPVILLDTLSEPDAFGAGPDYLPGMRMAFEYLLRNEKRNLVFVHDPVNIPKFAVYRQLCGEFNLESRELHYVSPSVGGEAPLVELGRSIAKSALPDALIVAADYDAALILQGLELEKLRVPRDLSIISIDDSLVSRITSPSLTTIRIDRLQMAETAFDLLAEIRKNPGLKPKHCHIPTELVIRKSVMEINSVKGEENKTERGN